MLLLAKHFCHGGCDLRFFIPLPRPASVLVQYLASMDVHIIMSIDPDALPGAEKTMGLCEETYTHACQICICEHATGEVCDLGNVSSLCVTIPICARQCVELEMRISADRASVVTYIPTQPDVSKQHKSLTSSHCWNIVELVS